MTPNAPKSRIKVILVDVDGTLIDTNDAHAYTWVEAFAENKRVVPFERVRPLIGMGGDQLIPRIAGVEKDTDEGKKLADAWARIFAEKYLPHAQPFPGAADLLKRMHDAGIKLIAASSGEKELADALLEKVGVKDLLADQTTSADAKRSKPAPDIVEAALKKGGAEPHETLMLGDSPYDIEAAQPVGVRVIALRCGGFSDENLRGALALYDSPADLLNRWDESPLGARIPD